MILTVTPNPSLDYLFEADVLCWDDANRVEMPRCRPGGQGINLTRAVRVLGGESTALAFLGGHAGRELQNMLAAESTPLIPVPIEAGTRVFFGVRETATGRSMLVNARGAVLGTADRERLLEQVRQSCREFKPEWVVCSGSIPRGVGDDLYARVAEVASEAGAQFIADCDGEALAQAIKRGCALIAPNKHEAERLARMQINSVASAREAARRLQKSAPEVYLKLGADGALAAVGEQAWLAYGPGLQSGSAVGAGDAFLAALLVAKKNGAPPEEALRCAVAAGTAVLLSRGSDLLTRQDYDNLLPSIQLTALNV